MDTSILKKNLLFRGFTDKEILAVIAKLSPREKVVRKHDTAVYDGDRMSEIGIVLCGCLRLSHIDENDNCNLMEVLNPSDSFGTMNAAGDYKLAFSAVASEDTRILFISIDPLFEPSARKDELLIRFLQNVAYKLAERAQALTKKLNDSIRRSTRERLSDYLSDESEKAGSKVFTIPLNRQELADFLFVDRSAMSNELSKMRDEGLIRFDKNHFELLLELPDSTNDG